MSRMGIRSENQAMTIVLVVTLAAVVAIGLVYGDPSTTETVVTVAALIAFGAVGYLVAKFVATRFLSRRFAALLAAAVVTALALAGGSDAAVAVFGVAALFLWDMAREKPRET